MTTHPGRAAMIELARRSRAGDLPPLEGPHRFDAELANRFRPAAVLVLLAPTLSAPTLSNPPQNDPTQTATPDSTAGPEVDVFLVQRSRTLRHHPGQISLPGGRIEPGEEPIEAALRETHEEIGLQPDRVEVLGQLPPVLVPVSSFVVHPVLGWTEASGFERAQPGEVLHCLRVPVEHLLDPQQRRYIELSDFPGRHLSHGFSLSVGWVWGFTGNLLDHVFEQMRWTRPWDTSQRYRMPMTEAMGHVPEPVPDEQLPDEPVPGDP